MSVQMTFVKHPTIKGYFEASMNGFVYYVNDTQFPLDTQYYDRKLVDEAISIIEKLPK